MPEEQLVMFPMKQMAGGGYEGAEQLSSRTVGTWYPPSGSADHIVKANKDVSDNRHNDIIRNDAFATGAMEKYQDSIVGNQFKVNSYPDIVALPAEFDEVWAEEFTQEVESLFGLWAESPNFWVDASGVSGFTELIRQAVGPSYLAYGEVLATAEWIRADGRLYNTAIQMIDPPRLSNPGNIPESKFFRSGVQKNRWGRPTAYYIRNSHPGDVVTDFEQLTWRRVPAYKPWGRKQVIHIVEQHRINQTRGIGKMVSALKEMRMRRSLNDLELQNVALNAMYAAVLETDLPQDVAISLVGGDMDDQGDNQAYTTLVQQVSNYFGGKNMYLDGVKVPVIPPGTHMKMQRNTGTANPQFSFEKSLNRYIARALGMSYEEFTGDFTETNYSSARAALGESWKMYQGKRRNVAERLANDIYCLWLEEAISKGQITSMPAGGTELFYEGMNKEAITRCRWLGAPKPEIDPEKERKADALGLANCTHTLEEVCAKRGMDWRDVLSQCAREQNYAAELGLNLTFGSTAAQQASQQEPVEEEPELDEDSTD